MTVIIDYGVGNLFSLTCSFNAIGADVTVSGDKDIIAAADKLILPGVGAFRDAASKLNAGGLGELVKQKAADGTPLLGICLGMQLLFDNSLEYGDHNGLGLIPGTVRPISDKVQRGLKIPQMGWNSLDFVNPSPIFDGIANGDFVYFVHSYYADCPRKYISAVTEYGAELTAAVRRGNVFGCQFHPEKSGSKGLEILKSFIAL